MKVFKIGSFLFTMAIAGVGVAMAVTNPGPEAYEIYATEQLSRQLEDQVCGKTPVFLGNVCGSILEDNQTWLREFVAESTQRQNFVILSIYTTDLSTSELLAQILPAGLNLSVEGLPTYHAETVGIFRQFYTYNAKRL